MEVEISWIFLNQEKQKMKGQLEKIENGFNNPKNQWRWEERKIIEKQIKTLKKYISLLDERMKLKEVKE